MKSYKVCWKDIYKNEFKELGIYPTLEEANKSIFDWWKKFNFEPPYIRNWVETTYKENDTTVIDYGRHNNFYLIIEMEN